MGEVWEAVHREQQVAVALKVLTTPLARDPAFQWIFRAEVRAMGSLDHPCVVQVYDLGRVDDKDAAGSGRFKGGSPYLVMELVGGRNLAGRVLSWPELRVVLRGLLRALGHAHARGVIHLDLKPANVLMDGEQVKLTDFGVAHALDREAPERDDGNMVGTPNFMAPEQIEGTWRQYGPWTDLYGVGCLAWKLAYGTVPFRRSTVWQTLSAHLRDPVPGPPDAAPVPAGFHAWLTRLLAKSPRDRFRRAGDAAWALETLGDEVVFGKTPVSALADGPLDATSTDPTVDMAPVPEDDATVIEPTHTWEPADPAEIAPSVAPMATTAPGCPDQWRRPTTADARPTDTLRGVGLGLYGVRVLPIVDRDEARDTLWGVLQAVCLERRARLAVLQGPSGCGKTRLARWLCERAHELGVAEPLDATHGPQPGPSHGLAQMVSRHARAGGLETDEVVAHARIVMRSHGGNEPEQWLSLAELIAPGSADGEAALHFSSAAERQQAVIRYVECVCAERPVILHLDDAQWGLGTLGFAARLLDRQLRRASPIFIVLTVRDDALASRPEERSALTALCGRPEAVEIGVPALPMEHRPALVRTLLGLHGDVARQVEERTAGNPLFAVQMVGDWVARGVLVPSATGFQLAEGEVPRLPDNLHDVWSAGIAKALEDRPEEDGVALELAAVLGGSPSISDWFGACRRAGVEGSFDLVERLVELRLARVLGGNDEVSTMTGASVGWAFVHSMLRESLVRRARDAGRWSLLNSACADMLARRSGRTVAERRGRHLVEAGRLEDAVEPLLAGAKESSHIGVLRDVDALLTLRDDVLTRLGVPESDARWGWGWLLRCRVAHRVGRATELRTIGARLEAAARTHGWTELMPFGLLMLGRGARVGGDMDAAGKALREAAGIAEASGALGECHRELAAISLELGQSDTARQYCRKARKDLDAAKELELAGLALLLESYIDTQAGDEAAARDALAKAQARFRRAGSRAGAAKCVNQLGELARYAGDLEAAEAFYRESIKLHDAVGDERAFLEMNLALTLTGREQFSEARTVLIDTLERLELKGRRPFAAAVRANLLTCYAGVGDWAAWDEEFETTARELAATSFVELDIARLTERAGELALAAGHTQRARQAFNMAADQLAELGRSADAVRVRARA